MKIKTLVLLVPLLTLAGAASAQDNSCAYTFTYPKLQFSFCVNVWGTLSSIQSPIGVNHLDATNPVEGWSASITDDGGGSDGGPYIPGLGAVSSTSPPTVTQPHGPGTLPLIFTYGSGSNFVERIDAIPFQREIYLTLKIASCFDCYWFGTVSRVANIRADGSSTGNFAHSSFSAFGYIQHGVMLSVAEDGTGCAGTDPNGASQVAYVSCSLSNIPFTGPGAVFSSWGFYSALGKPQVMKAVYRVF
jgi:hypothetical protein